MSTCEQVPGLTTMRASPTSEYIEFFAVSPLTVSSGNSEASWSGTSNASASATLKKQGTRMDRFLKMMQNQTDVLMKHAETLTTHGESLKEHNLVICQLVKDQQKLDQRVHTDVTRITERLEMMEGQIEELRQGRNPGSDEGIDIDSQRKGITSSPRENPKVQRSPSSAKDKSEYVQCSYCQKTLKRSYIREHMKRWCRVLRQQQ